MGRVMENLSKEEEEIIFRSRHSGVPIPENVTLPEFVLENAELYADKVAFVEVGSGKRITHGEVVRDTERFAKALRSLGLRKGNVVIVVLPNVAEYAIIALGIMVAGGVFSGANPTAHVSEIKKQAESANAKLIVTNGLNYEKVIPFFLFLFPSLKNSYSINLVNLDFLWFWQKIHSPILKFGPSILN